MVKHITKGSKMTRFICNNCRKVFEGQRITSDTEGYCIKDSEEHYNTCGADYSKFDFDSNENPKDLKDCLHD